MPKVGAQLPRAGAGHPRRLSALSTVLGMDAIPDTVEAQLPWAGARASLDVGRPILRNPRPGISAAKLRGVARKGIGKVHHHRPIPNLPHANPNLAPDPSPPCRECP